MLKPSGINNILFKWVEESNSSIPAPALLLLSQALKDLRICACGLCDVTVELASPSRIVFKLRVDKTLSNSGTEILLVNYVGSYALVTDTESELYRLQNSYCIYLGISSSRSYKNAGIMVYPSRLLYIDMSPYAFFISDQITYTPLKQFFYLNNLLFLPYLILNYRKDHRAGFSYLGDSLHCTSILSDDNMTIYVNAGLDLGYSDSGSYSASLAQALIDRMTRLAKGLVSINGISDYCDIYQLSNYMPIDFSLSYSLSISLAQAVDKLIIMLKDYDALK